MVKGIKIKKPHLPKFRKSQKRISNDIPGSIVYTGDKEPQDTRIDVIDYSMETYYREESAQVDIAFDKANTAAISWINVNGLGDTRAIEKLGHHYGLHPLILEDIADTNQRPKIDEYHDYIFVVFKMLYFNDHGVLVNEHLSLVLGADYVITFQEADGDVFDSLRQRIAFSKGRIRAAGSDYLMFALMDAVVDHYFTLVETMGERIEALEDSLFLNNVNGDITQEIQELKREILRIRKAVHPFREVINRLEKIENHLIEERTMTYIRDLYDHIIQVTEGIDIYREMTWGLMDMYMTTISNKMNEVMKVLTIMASIFIPLTFMAGIYGMNFEHMPELQLRYGYYYLWGAMILVFCSLLWYFKTKKWL
ncbi:MAG: magnesium/cobalt transporter CorA [Leeuwenhoekiella sp.]